MHVLSLIPCLGLTLFPLIYAASISETLPLKRDGLSVSTNLPSGWYYKGCYSDSTSNRALSSDQYYDNSGMTEESCINYCQSKGYGIAGVEYSSECYCGYQLGSSATNQSDSDCNMACSGNSQEPCGGPSRMNVFSTNNLAPTVDPGSSGYSSIGCYTDSVSARTLNTSVQVPGGSSQMSVHACNTACGSQGFKYSGLEYGQECWCGNALQNGGAPASSGCNMICTGQNNEFCGGSNRLNLYQRSTAAQQVLNPSFESGSSNWQTNPSSAGSGGLNGYFQSDSTHAHTGTGYFFVTASQSSGVSGSRGICISQYVYVQTPGSYTLSFYIGGVNEFMPDPRSSVPPQYSLTFSASLAGSTYTGSVCEGSCSVPNVGGINAYNYYSYKLNVPSGYDQLVICANYAGIRRGQDDYFYLDDVNLVGPN